MTEQKVVVAGGSGLIGAHLAESMSHRGAEVVILTRKPDSRSPHRQVQWDGENVSDWANELEGATAVINLSGASLMPKWTDDRKRAILASRVQSTRAIGTALLAAKNPPKSWINASAVGIYGDTGDEPLAESARAGEGFLAEVGQKWEEACLSVDLPDVTQTVIRTGVVLSPSGGILPVLSRLTAFGLGGAAGHGRQWLSWIHIDDLVQLYMWAVHAGLEGAINGVAPSPVTNSEFMAELRRQIGRPRVPNAPEFLIRLGSKLMGKEGSLLLESQRVYPKIAEANGFQFAFPRLNLALVDLLK